MYDAIVIGARCAGSATAMLLARAGLRVLLTDRAALPSDIPHGHFIHRGGPRRLARWGLLEAILATGCPPITSITSDMGDFPLTCHDLVEDGAPLGVAPRRSRLDAVLADAAVAAGAELRDCFAVVDYRSEDATITGIVGRDARTGARLTEHARIVIGADGRNSGLARFVAAPVTTAAPAMACWYFTYFSGVADRGLELYAREGSVMFVFPTNDELTGVFVGFPIGELARVRADIEAALLAAADAIDGVGERIRAGRREERCYGATQLPNFLRVPHGSGWALVGDAGCHKDPYMALGICDALRDAELLAGAVVEGLTGARPLAQALAGYERARDAQTLPDYHQNLALARLEAVDEGERRLRAALRHDPAATEHFYRALQGMVDPRTFFDDANLGAIIAAHAAGSAAS